MEKLLQSLCSAQSAKDIKGRIFNEDETKLPPSQTYEISKFSCIISRITTLALHFLIFRNVISLPLLQFPNFQHYIVTLPYQVPRRLGLSYFVIFLPTTYFVHRVGSKLAPSLDILHFRGNHFPTKLANFVSIRISDSQVLLHFRLNFNLFLSIPDDHRNNNLKLKSLLNLSKLAMFGFHLKYYTFQLWGTAATTKASNFLLKSFYRCLLSRIRFVLHSNSQLSFWQRYDFGIQKIL